MEQILVAVDFSACSRHALQAAIELSRVFAARLHVVHVTRDTRHKSAGAETVLPVGDHATPLERELANLIIDEFKGTAEDFLRIDKRILLGHEAEEILKEARRTRASLIALGTHGRSAFGRLLFGSVSERVLRESELPVLLVGESAGPRFENILLAIDEICEPDVQLFGIAADWRKAFGARLEVLHVERDRGGAVPLSLESERQLEELCCKARVEREEWLKTCAVDAFPEAPPPIEFTLGDAESRIENKIERGEFDLTILSKYSTLGSPLMPLHIVQRSPCATLVVPELMVHSN
jgi:nucleotide-binding universal stress UspA family protein